MATKTRPMQANTRTDPRRLAIRELARRELARRSSRETYADFVSRIAPKFVWYPHCIKIAKQLQRVADGELKRLIIMAPPRHGKTEQCSRLFPAYLLHRYPERWVGLASYSAELAHTLSRNARQNYQRAGHKLSDEAAAVKHWETGIGGGLWAAGVGGSMTGKGGHFLLIDDPLKNREEADSALMRAKQKDWYTSTWLTREEPDAAQVVTMTRWNEDDLVGWLLAEELEGDKPERWHILSLPAIAEPQSVRPDYPESCEVEPDERQEGEALCPERYPIDKLERRKLRLGPYNWNALYQQRPRPQEGNLCKREWLSQFAEATPAGAKRARWWDKAGTQDDGDFTSGVLLAKAEGRIFVEDVVRGQWSAGARDKIIEQTAELDAQKYGADLEICSAQDPGQAGKSDAAQFVRMLSRYRVHTQIESGDKVVRAGPFLSQAEAGNVLLLRGKWNRPYIDTMIEFPGKVNDDMDATANAYNRLSGGPSPMTIHERPW
jgi:predicted phage terminase large subunit-like protein